MSPFKLYLYSLIVRLLPETRGFALKRGLLRWCGATIGQNVRINSSVVFSGNGKLSIGDDVWIGPGCFISPVGTAMIKIGNCVDIGPQVMILTGGHQVDLEGAHSAGEGKATSTTICDGCWISARSIVSSGVILPPKTIVAAGAVVTKVSAPKNGILTIRPAKVMKASIERE